MTAIPVRLRRLAALLAIAVAGFSSLATSSVATPPPTVEGSVEGSFELSADAPVAVRQFSVRIALPGVEITQFPAVTFKPSAVFSTSDDSEEVWFGVRDVNPTDGSHEGYRALLRAEESPPSYNLPCDDAGICQANFAVIAQWADPGADATATIDWRVAATVGLWSGAAVNPLPTVQLDAAAADLAPHLNAARAVGEPVRLDATHRLAQWRVTLRLPEAGPEPQDGVRRWPVLATARLSPTKDIVVAPDENPGSVLAFIDSISDDTIDWFGTDLPEDAIEFEPVWVCPGGGTACSASYVVGVTMPDVRPESVVDAGVRLDVRTIGMDGSDLPIEVEIEPVADVAMALGSTSGRLEFNQANRPTFRYTVSGQPIDAVDEELRWVRVPTYGHLRARLTSTGSTPLPEGFGVNFGSGGSDMRLTLDEPEVTAVFGVDAGCRFGPEPCLFDEALRTGFSPEGLPSGWGFAIDWELEIALGTTDPDGGRLTIVDITNATPPP